jgi:hypothetical protein
MTLMTILLLSDFTQDQKITRAGDVAMGSKFMNSKDFAILKRNYKYTNNQMTKLMLEYLFTC